MLFIREMQSPLAESKQSQQAEFVSRELVVQDATFMVNVETDSTEEFSCRPGMLAVMRKKWSSYQSNLAIHT